MKHYTILLLSVFALTAQAQNTRTSGKYGNTLNVGLGVGGYSGYYGYVGRGLPVVNVNYEFDVANSFTLAPFVTVYSYKNRYYWGDAPKNYPYRYYTYRETVIPIGVKGSLYLDKVLGAGASWDFYLAGSLGVAIVRSSWDENYYGDKNYYRRGNTLFADVHLGAEYHLNSKLGLYLDLSNGVSTLGLAIH